MTEYYYDNQSYAFTLSEWVALATHAHDHMEFYRTAGRILFLLFMEDSTIHRVDNELFVVLELDPTTKSDLKVVIDSYTKAQERKRK